MDDDQDARGRPNGARPALRARRVALQRLHRRAPVRGAVARCWQHGVARSDIEVVRVPGAFEPAARRRAAGGEPAASTRVVALGAVIRGATPHFDYVAGECAAASRRSADETGVPVGFGVLTTDTIEQAIERAGTKAGNKGADAALAAIEMANLLRQLESEAMRPSAPARQARAAGRASCWCRRSTSGSSPGQSVAELTRSSPRTTASALPTRTSSASLRRRGYRRRRARWIALQRQVARGRSTSSIRSSARSSGSAVRTHVSRRRPDRVVINESGGARQALRRDRRPQVRQRRARPGCRASCVCRTGSETRPHERCRHDARRVRAHRAVLRPAVLRGATCVLGIGDDAAVLAVPDGPGLAGGDDTLVDGRAFPRDAGAASARLPALAVNLSDLAAMGAQPRWCTLALSLPRVRHHWLEGFARGCSALAERYGITLVGGDTVARAVALSRVQVTGLCQRRCAARATARRPGDDLYVTGTLGDAAAGLAVLHGRRRQRIPIRRWCAEVPVHRARAARRHGAALVGREAAIDVSDGLLGDLGKLLRRERVGATLDLERAAAVARAAARFRRRESARASRSAAATTTSCVSRRRRRRLRNIETALGAAGSESRVSARLVAGHGVRVSAPDGYRCSSAMRRIWTTSSEGRASRPLVRCAIRCISCVRFRLRARAAAPGTAAFARARRLRSGAVGLHRAAVAHRRGRRRGRRCLDLRRERAAARRARSPGHRLGRDRRHDVASSRRRRAGGCAALAFASVSSFRHLKPWPIREVDHSNRAVAAELCLTTSWPRFYAVGLVVAPLHNVKPTRPSTLSRSRNRADAIRPDLDAGTHRQVRTSCNEVGRGSTGRRLSLSHDPFYGRDVAIKLYHIDDGRRRRARATRARCSSAKRTWSACCSTRTSCRSTTRARRTDAATSSPSTSTARARCPPTAAPATCCRSTTSSSIVFKCAKALHYAHARGVIHRDIKPSNIC